jgi:MFS transporter, CP family, cyanate transporter
MEALMSFVMPAQPGSSGDASQTPLVEAELASSATRASGLSFGLAAVCIVLVALALRPGLVSMGPLLPAIRDAFGLSHTQAALLISIPDVIMGALALPTPWLARRFGRDRVIVAALALLSASMLLRALTHTTATLLIATAGVGAGIAIAGALIAGFIKATFPARAALLMGVYATALSLGSTLAAAVTGPVAQSGGGWRLGSGAWAVLGGVAIATWLFVDRRIQARPAVGAAAARRYPLPLGVGLAWLVGLFFACDNFLFYGCLSWIAAIYREHGYSETNAGLILAVYTCTFVVSTPLAGALSKTLDRRVWLAVWSALALGGALSLAIAPYAMPYVSVAVIALGVGGGFTLGMTLPLDNAHEPEEANSWNAFVLMLGYVIAAAGPLAVGALRDVTGGFAAPLWMLAGVGGLMLILSPLLKPRLAP